MKSIEGVLPALVTPYSDDGSIHEESLRRLIDLNLEKGVDGFYVCGSTAEAFLLSHDERKHIAQIAVEHVKGRVPVVVHVGSIQTACATDLARHAAETGADVVSAIPPFYYQFNLDEIKAYYRDIAAAAGLPLILYNFPAFSGVTLDQHVAGDLFADERVVGIKHTSLDMFQLERMKSENPGIVVLNGHDEVFLSGLAAGADGAVGSTYNFMAEKFLAIRRHFAAGQIAQAQAVQTQANEIIDVLRSVGVFQGIKHILSTMGIPCGECRRPFLPLSDQQKSQLEEVMSNAGAGRG